MTCHGRPSPTRSDHDASERPCPYGVAGFFLRADVHARESSMRRYTAHVGFTLVAIWIAVIFVLASSMKL